MNKTMTNLVDKLLENGHKKPVLKILEKIFNNGIPFNLPHKFIFKEITDKKIQLILPYIKKNKNHLGGIHACATATLGEYSAGLSLIRRFGSSKYRLIMEELHADYIKQVKEEVIGVVELDEAEKERIEKELNETGSCKVDISTNILNQNDEVIAVVQTKWQLKSWNKVTYK